MGFIFYLMGKSSSGKDTIYKEIKKRNPGLRTMVSYTTRPRRANEQNGTEYFFVTEDEMRQVEQEGRLIEKRAYQTVHGIWNYFTADDGQIDLRKDNYLLIGTLESYEKIRNYYGQECVVPIYIEVEDGIRLQRAIERERKQEKPKYKEMCRRFLADEEDFKEENIIRCGITKRFENQELERCIDEIETYIRGFQA